MNRYIGLIIDIAPRRQSYKMLESSILFAYIASVTILLYMYKQILCIFTALSNNDQERVPHYLTVHSFIFYTETYTKHVHLPACKHLVSSHHMECSNKNFSPSQIACVFYEHFI